MTSYLVTWDIEIEAGSPIEAAQLALVIQRDPTSTATCFVIADSGAGVDDPSWQVDLLVDPPQAVEL